MMVQYTSKKKQKQIKFRTEQDLYRPRFPAFFAPMLRARIHKSTKEEEEEDEEDRRRTGDAKRGGKKRRALSKSAGVFLSHKTGGITGLEEAPSVKRTLGGRVRDGRVCGEISVRVNVPFPDSGLLYSFPAGAPPPPSFSHEIPRWLVLLDIGAVVAAARRIDVAVGIGFLIGIVHLAVEQGTGAAVGSGVGVGRSRRALLRSARDAARRRSAATATRWPGRWLSAGQIVAAARSVWVRVVSSR